MTKKIKSIQLYIRNGRLVNTATASFNTITGQMTEMTKAHFGIRLLSGIFAKKSPKCTWLCAGIPPVR